MSVRALRVLALDGGGIRGLYTTTLLQQLALRVARLRNSDAQTRLDIGGQFDLIAGTSTGSILAIAMAAGVALEDVIGLYRKQAAHIFQNSMPLQGACWHDRLRALLWAVARWRRPANQSGALRRALESVLCDETLGEMYARRRIALCVPTIDAETQRAWVFKTPHAVRLTRDNRYRLVDVCMASAAAPIYFPMHRVPPPDHNGDVAHSFVDGGLWANDPVLVALAEALEMAEDGQPIEILSVGTCPGVRSKMLTPCDANRGMLGWLGGTEVVAMSLTAQASVTHYLAQKMASAMGGRVTLHRLIEPEVSAAESKHLALDAVDPFSLAHLEKLALRATDLNMSALTNSPNPSRGAAMTLAVLSDIKPLKEASHGL